MVEVLKAERVKYSYGEIQALNGVSFSLYEGEILSILGPNGGGKSTLLKIVSGILKNYEGSVKLYGKEVSVCSIKELARIISYIPQEFSPAFDLRCETIVLFGRNPHVTALHSFTKDDYKIIEESMKRADALEFRDRLFNTLSGGERQRVVIAKAIAQKGKIMLLDEFTTHLDPGHSQKLIELVKNMMKLEGITAINVAHDINQAINMSDRIAFLKDGKILAVGKAEEILTETLIEKVYDAKSTIIENPLTKKPLVVFY
ncbi:ABC transporter ATP-binding protein [Kosmotoga pacifica]|uniref:ABC transporter n=1 Tax=Kosmotoga pacifica TaxID=1330330 RepID=A0A0G2Z5V3_9BACT|nr:ABC transporter ATP-binding protein [Kosmotoga pacifica]AKI96985.1 ABC transporter [Kosmotoga pacifica]